MANELINIDEITIIRERMGDEGNYYVVAKVLDDEGVEHFSFPDGLSDVEINNILKGINAAYKMGFEDGSSRRARDICKLLGIKPEAWEILFDGE